MQDPAPLYGILDLGYVRPQDAPEVAAALLAGGVGILQIRGKKESRETIAALARQILAPCRGAGVPLIINDHPDLAGETDADGFHLGQDDGTSPQAEAAYHAARREATPRAPIIGRSTHSVEQALAAHAGGADYIGFGPLFPTPTKPGRPAIGTGDIATVHRLLPAGFPIYCIGGIKPHNLPEVIAAGARRAVIVSGLLQADDVAAAARQAAARLSATTAA